MMVFSSILQASSMSISFLVFDIKNFLMREIAEMVKKTNQKKILSNTIIIHVSIER